MGWDEDDDKTDPDKTIATDIENAPTQVITDEDDDKTDPSLHLDISLSKPIKQLREDPRKVHSVKGTFKVYIDRKGHDEEYVFKGLRAKDYSEKEIALGYQQYLQEKESRPESFLLRMKRMFRHFFRR